MGNSRESRDDEEYNLPLFETKESKGRLAYRLFSVSTFICICLILVYRVRYIVTEFVDGGEFGESGRWCWIGLFACEIWFTIYWLFTQAVRWNVIYRNTFRHRLSLRSSYLVYLSDDGGSELTFYALLEASHFAKFWVPFCKKFKVQPRSPMACVSNPPAAALNSQEWSNIKLFQFSVSRYYTRKWRNESKLQRSWEGFLKKCRLSTKDFQNGLPLLLSTTIQQSFRVREDDETKDDVFPILYETKKANKDQLVIRWLFLISTLISICLVWFYRFKYDPRSVAEADNHKLGTIRWIWIASPFESSFSSHFQRHTVTLQVSLYHSSYRGGGYEEKLPRVDVFVYTANPVIEPPAMVINTVLSVMAYDYPPEKLSIYLSDDGYLIPFCKKFQVEPRSPIAYFSSNSNHSSSSFNSKEWSAMKILYEKMENRIEAATKLGKVPDEMRARHKGFSEWDSVSSPRDHQTILQILIDSRTPDAVDMEGSKLPTLVYMAREKRPQHHHKFKAGAMNSLIRVSSKISNGSIILNVDCDMYSNNSISIRDALCFFINEEKRHEIAYVQFPRNFDNIGKNDLYGGVLRVIAELFLHIREEKKYNFSRLKTKGYRRGSVAKKDVLTGLTIQCRGWKSVYLNPERKGFLGVAPNRLCDTLVQHKRWSEGDFQIFLSKYNPFLYGHKKISLGLQMGYCVYCLWAPNSLPTLYYLSIPPLCLLKGIPLFPKVLSFFLLWFLPFAYLIISTYTYSLAKFLLLGRTLQGWWNEQRIWMFKRTTSYLFAIIDSISKLLGLSKSAFVITSKVVEEDVSDTYEKEIMDFGTSSRIFTTIIATLALIKLFSLV
ncbi:hypothetical protein C5167_009599 [Papaver somniferum]|uniref:Glycosyltransferase 2-like domain-containing protein n=1 Tax=Papaver somniferum TaxID=3469 RepID=A0A4Y7K1U0_PAPSO|nr:hypothetical protein C5167_009599 [Papaver somniferum]